MFRLKGFGLLLALAFLGVACSGNPTEAPQDGDPENGRAVNGASVEEADTQSLPSKRMLPVPINEGLASLDSYRMTYINDVYDSAPDQRSVITFVVARDTANNASYNSTETLVTTEDYQETSSQLQEQYIIGNQICILSDGEAQFTSISDMARQLTDFMTQGIQFNPPIENPEYAGEGVIDGLPVRNYNFLVTSVKATADEEVARAEGHYSLADDGDYLVEYRLDMELRSAPEGDLGAEYSISFFDLKLEDINKGVQIAFPEACLNAQAFGPDGF